MEAFATVDDLLAGWPGHPDIDDETAETLLLRATAQLTALLSRHHVGIDPEDEVQRVNLTGAVCSMVRGSMAQPYEGVASISQGIGSTSASVSFANPDGGFYVSKHWRDLLGISGGGKVRQVRAAVHNPDGTPAEGW